MQIRISPVTRARLAGAALAAALAACVDAPAGDPAVGPADPTTDEAAAAEAGDLARAPQRHCNVPTTATRAGAAPPADAPAAAAECFDSFSDAIFAATRGAVRLPDNATPETVRELPAAQLAALGTYLIAIEYVAPRWDAFWGSRNFTSSVTCDQGYTLSYANLSSIGWNDKISSVYTLPGCAHAFHYEHASFGGARLDCHPAPPGGGDPCYYGLGALDDRTSSIRWTNNPW